MTRLIPLSRGLSATIDECDYPLVAGRSWHAVPIRSNLGRYYARAGTGTLMHRVLMGLKLGDGLQVDHINMDGLDNRRVNLRVCTNAENHRNGKPLCGRKYKGCYRNSNIEGKQWVARIKHNQQTLTIGYYGTEIEAAMAYDVRALELGGEFARLNFPVESVARN